MTQPASIEDRWAIDEDLDRTYPRRIEVPPGAGPVPGADPDAAGTAND